MRRATRTGKRAARKNIISIHALLAESDSSKAGRNIPRTISIHALLAESDALGVQAIMQDSQFLSTLSLRRATVLVMPCGAGKTISIHALLAESDPETGRGMRLPTVFLSTLSLRRATDILLNNMMAKKDFYPRSPCGERPGELLPEALDIVISIHALLAESDGTHLFWCLFQNQFLSTLSLRRATCTARVTLPPRGYFYPRSPCGERLTFFQVCTVA